MKKDPPKQVRDAVVKRRFRRYTGDYKHLDIGYSMLTVGYSKKGVRLGGEEPVASIRKSDTFKSGRDKNTKIRFRQDP